MASGHCLQCHPSVYPPLSQESLKFITHEACFKINVFKNNNIAPPAADLAYSHWKMKLLKQYCFGTFCDTKILLA